MWPDRVLTGSYTRLTKEGQLRSLIEKNQAYESRSLSFTLPRWQRKWVSCQGHGLKRKAEKILYINENVV